MKEAAVIVSVFSIDRANDVMRCIESIKKQTVLPKEIIVVLDPDEDLIDFYKEQLDDSVKIVVSTNFGLSFARNAGVMNSQTEIVVFVDDDAVADERWLENLLRNYDDPSVIGVGGRIDPLWHRGNPGWFPKELYWIIGCSYEGLPTKKSAVRNPIGCNMSFRRNVIEKTGYFNTSFGRVGNNLAGHDDTEISVRATSKFLGAKILYDPGAVVFHRVQRSRLTLRYIMKRSFNEGLSKAELRNQKLYNSNALITEQNYLQGLLLNGILKKLSLNDGLKNIRQIVILSLSVPLVLFGYVVGRC